MGSRTRERQFPGALVGVVAGALAVVAALAGAFAVGFGRAAKLKDLIGAGRPSARVPGLAAAILGNTKYSVASILGPPRIATFSGALPTQYTYMDADTWYYPLKRQDSAGIAISFDGTTATKVDFFNAPRS